MSLQLILCCSVDDCVHSSAIWRPLVIFIARTKGYNDVVIQGDILTPMPTGTALPPPLHSTELISPGHFCAHILWQQKKGLLGPASPTIANHPGPTMYEDPCFSQN